MLNTDLLTRFDDALRRAGASIVEYWAPGLTDAEIDEIAGRHRVVLPEEARVLWRWHNGVSSGAPPAARRLGPDRLLLGLSDALEDYEESAEIIRGSWGLDRLWEPFLGMPIILLDLGNANDDGVPILVSHDWVFEPEPSLPSLRDLFDTWTRLLDEGVWRVGDDGSWEGDYVHRVPQDIVDLGVY